MAETVRGGLQGVPEGQEEAAYSLGLSWWQVQTFVTLPQALRHVVVYRDFVFVKFSVMAEITDADALREAALTKFDANDSTTDDYPDTADWHASEEGQQERRQVATQDVDALNQFVDPAKACELLDGVPGVKAIPLGSAVGPMEGTTQDEARDAWAEREGIPWWREARDAERARQHREGIT